MSVAEPLPLDGPAVAGRGGPLGPVAVCRVEDLDVERGVAALVHGHQVAVFRLVDGSVRAIDHRDPATGVNVLARGLLGSVGDEWYVASPLHKQRFSLDSGRCLSDDRLAVGVHRVDLRDGVVRVSLGSSPAGNRAETG